MWLIAPERRRCPLSPRAPQNRALPTSAARWGSSQRAPLPSVKMAAAAPGHVVGAGFPLLSVAARRRDGGACAGALSQPGQGQRPPLPPSGAPRRAALPSRALRLRGDQGAAGRRVRAMPPEVRTGTGTLQRHGVLSRLPGAGRRSLVRAARVRRYRLRCGVRGCVRARGRRHGAGVCTCCSYRFLPGTEREFNLGSPFVLTSVWFSSCLCIPRASLPVLTVHLSCSLKRWWWEPPSTRETLPRVLPGTLTSELSALRAQKRSGCFCEGRRVPLGLWGGAVVPSAEVLWAVMRSHLGL